jgi:hypothetical protein
MAVFHFLQVHGEVTDPHVDTFDREKVFIEKILAPLVEKLPQLKIVMEHITTKDAVNFVESCKEGVCYYNAPSTSVCPLYRLITFCFVLRSCCCNGYSTASPSQPEFLVSGWFTASQLLLASTKERNSQYNLLTLVS